MSRRALEQYRTVRVATAQPAQILVMLYAELFRLLGEAELQIANRNVRGKGESISRALAILGELSAGLDHAMAPELCERLDGLYTYSMDRLTEANLRVDSAPIADVRRVLEPLRVAWTRALETTAAETTAPVRIIEVSP